MKPYRNIQEAIWDFSDRIERLEAALKKGRTVKLYFVIQRSIDGTFWSENGWVNLKPNAAHFVDEQHATDSARDFAKDLDEQMRVILDGPQLVATVNPPRPIH